MGSGVTGLYRMLRTYGDTILRATRELFRCHPFVVPFIRDGSSSVVSPPPLSLSLSPSFFFVSMPRNHLPRGFINTRTHVPARDSHLSSLLSFLLLFSSSHGQFSKVQRALIIEEAGANNPASIPVCAGGRKEGREEWWKTTTIVVAWIHKRWPSTRWTETGPEFSSC